MDRPEVADLLFTSPAVPYSEPATVARKHLPLPVSVKVKPGFFEKGPARVRIGVVEV